MPKTDALDLGAKDFVRTAPENRPDIFADIFASSTNETAASSETDVDFATEIEVVSATEKPVSRWHQSLPEISASEVERSNVFIKLPDGLADKLLTTAAGSLSVYTNSQVAAICELIFAEQVDLLAASTDLIAEQPIFLSFMVEPAAARGVLALDAAFAVKTIKKGFGYENAEEEKRSLSKNELAVLEFFALGCASDFNQAFAEPLFRLQTVEQTPPDWSVSDSDETAGLLAKIKIQLDDIVTVAQLLVPFRLLESLNEASNPLLTKAARARRNQKFSQIVSGVGLRVVVGETVLKSIELAALEVGDVILLERPAVEFADRTLIGIIQIRVGQESQPSLYGDLSTAGQLNFTVREISQSDEVRKLIRLKMENDELTEASENDSPDDNIGLALEKVVVTLTAEIAARRVTLDELAALRVNQVLELGVKPTDPIELTADGRTIAIGELVNIEDNLGVRLTKIVL